jgi:hypothetical protein
MLLNWDDVECRSPYQSGSRSTFYVNATAWSRGLEVTGGGTGVVSHAGLVLLRQLADRTGLTAGLSAVLPSPDGGLDRGRVSRISRDSAIIPSWPNATTCVSRWRG